MTMAAMRQITPVARRTRPAMAIASPISPNSSRNSHGSRGSKAMLAALEEQPGRYDTSSLVNIVSSGVMWSKEVKQALLRHIPQAIMVDSFGSSEAVGFGTSMMTG